MLKKIITIILTLSGTLVFGLPENITAGIPESAEGNLIANDGFKKYDYPFNIKVPEKVKEMAIRAIVDESYYFGSYLSRNLNIPDTIGFYKRMEFIKNRITRFYGMKIYHFKYTPKKLKESSPVKEFITWRDSSYLIFIGVGNKDLKCVAVETLEDGTLFPLKPRDSFAAKIKEEMEKVIEIWPPSNGYHPIAISFPLYLDATWYFHVPEVDSCNLTPFIKSYFLEYAKKGMYRRKNQRNYSNLNYKKGLLNKVKIKERFKSYKRLKQKLKQRAEEIKRRRNDGKK